MAVSPHKVWFCILVVGIFFVCRSAYALVTIGFDDVNSYTQIDTYYKHLGVIFLTEGEDSYSDGHAYARSSSLAKSPSNVIGSYKSGYTYLNDKHNWGVALFNGLTDRVSIWAEPYGSETPSAWIKAYGPSGYLLEKVVILSSVGGEGKEVSITTVNPSIAKVEFSGNGKRVCFDNFSFNELTPIIPEPATLLLMISGIIGIVALRSRFI